MRNRKYKGKKENTGQYARTEVFDWGGVVRETEGLVEALVLLEVEADQKPHAGHQVFALHCIERFFERSDASRERLTANRDAGSLLENCRVLQVIRLLLSARQVIRNLKYWNRIIRTRPGRRSRTWCSQDNLSGSGLCICPTQANEAYRHDQFSVQTRQSSEALRAPMSREGMHTYLRARDGEQHARDGRTRTRDRSSFHLDVSSSYKSISCTTPFKQ